MAFLFLDECSYERLDLAALTGVLIPLEQYTQVRDHVCQIVWDVLAPSSNTVPPPIELHARNLLPSHPDRERLEVFSRIVGIVNEHQLNVFRVAYLNRKEIAAVAKLDPKLYGLNFLGIIRALEDTMRDILVLPVMDGVPGYTLNAKKAPAIDPFLIRAFAQTVRYIHHVRCSDSGAHLLSLKNLGNLGEPVFADDSHSTLLQLADVVSHLLLQVERNELEASPSRSEYRGAVLHHARQLEPHLLHCEKGHMQFG